MRYMRYRDENLILQYLFPMDIILQGPFTVKCVIADSSNRMYRCTTENKMNCKNKDPNKG
jgi:hypothetical protein